MPLIFVWLFLASCASVLNSSENDIFSNKEAKFQRVRTNWNEVWEKGNLQAVADFYHSNAKHGDDYTIKDFQKECNPM